MSKEYVKKIDLRLEMKFKSEFRIIGFCLDDKVKLFFKHKHEYTFKKCLGCISRINFTFLKRTIIFS